MLTIRLREIRVESFPIGALKSQMEKVLSSRHPRATWLSREIVELNGRDWVRVEVRTQADDAARYNLIHFSSGGWLLVVVNLLADGDDYAPLRDGVLRSMETFRIID